MATKQLFFLGDMDDIEYILASIELVEDIQYCEAGTFDKSDIPKYSSYKLLSNIGTVNHGDWVLNKMYCVCSKLATISERKIHLKKGGLRYAVDQADNADSIIIKPSGVFEQGILVAGSIGTISMSPFSIHLYNKYASLIKKEFKKIDEFYLGPGASNKLDSGWRLVTNAKSPNEYDLRSS